MLELMQRLIAFKYSCKISHWRTDDYARHLLYDRLQSDIDDIADDLAEHYFMPFDRKNMLDEALFHTAFMNKDAVAGIKAVIDHVEDLLASEEITEGVKALLSGIADNFNGKLALARMK